MEVDYCRLCGIRQTPPVFFQVIVRFVCNHRHRRIECDDTPAAKL